MHRRSLGRASALATVALLAVSGLASADSVLGDANIVVDGTQGARYLGQFPASTEITVPVEFVMTCATSNHPDLGQTVALALGSASVTGPGGEVLEHGAGDDRPDRRGLAGRRRPVARPRSHPCAAPPVR